MFYDYFQGCVAQIIDRLWIHGQKMAMAAGIG